MEVSECFKTKLCLHTKNLYIFVIIGHMSNMGECENNLYKFMGC